MALVKALNDGLRIRGVFVVRLVGLSSFLVALMILAGSFKPSVFCQSCGTEEVVIFSAFSAIVSVTLGFVGFWLMVVEHDSLHRRTPSSDLKERATRN